MTSQSNNIPDLLESITEFDNAQESGDVQMRVFECSMAMAITFLKDNPTALARIATAAIEAATDEEVDIESCDVLSAYAGDLNEIISKG